MENKSIITKKAVTYSLLAHINNSKKLSRGPLDIFIPIVKKSLHLMNFEGQFKGENISEISNYISKCYELDIPVPVLRNILKLISQEIKRMILRLFCIMMTVLSLKNLYLKISIYRLRKVKEMLSIYNSCSKNSVLLTNTHTIVKE